MPTDQESAPPRSLGAPPSPYDSVFVFSYFANTFLTLSMSLLFRYSDFVHVAGGTEWELGLIAGVGTTGAILMRVGQGVGVDRWGPKLIWILSLMTYSAAILMHLWIESVHSPVVYAVRILMQCGLAGTFGASLAFISLRVERHRVTEIIGMLGTSGFVGMAIGPIIGDWLFAQDQSMRARVDWMFMAATLFALGSLICAILATRGKIHRRPTRQIPALAIVRRYHPGWLLLIAAAMGMGIGMPGVFLRPFTESVQIDNIRVFFLVYNLFAFGVRIATRRLPGILGERKMILLGMISLAASMPSYLVVQETWHLAIPAALAGTGHAFLFPAVVGGSGHVFPTRYRGLATALALGAFDLGNLIGHPTLGGVITVADQNGWPAYPTMFLTAAVIILVITLLYAAFGGRHRRA